MARICMVGYTYYLTDSRVRREAEALADRGDTVDVISLGREGVGGVYGLRGVRVIQVLGGRYRGSSIGMYLGSYCLFFLAASVRLALLHLRNRYQIVQVHTMPDFMVFVATIPKLLGAKVILDVHDLSPELYQSKFGTDAGHWLIRFIAWMERQSIGFANRAIAVHRPHLEALVRHGNPVEKFIILLNVPDPRVFSGRGGATVRQPSGFELIYHGTVAERHGLEVALKAIAALKEEIVGLRLVVVGEGDALAGLVELARELELTDCVEFKGFVPLEELVPTILAADAGIVPVLLDDFTQYMLPVKLLEYVALGKPTICSRTDTIEAYFDDSMLLFFTPGNAHELAEQIRSLYRNPARREELALNADRFNREHQWRYEKQRYYRLVDDLTGGVSREGEKRLMGV